jgi:hypothetical protein
VSDGIDWLPELVPRAEGVEMEAYLDILFNHFANDFVSNPPLIHDRQVRVRKEPETNGRHYTFWHVISDGDCPEDLRELRSDRCERILWPKEIIVRCTDPAIRRWRAIRKGQLRGLIALPNFSYLIVLSLRGENAPTLITAYDVEHKRQRKRLAEEWGEWQKTKTP